MNEVKIRASEMTDWEDAAKIFLAPNCRWGTLQMPYQSRDAIRKKLENPPPGMYRLVAVLNDQKIVGMTSLKTYEGRRAYVGAIGMFVQDDHQNQGISSLLLEAVIELAEKWLNFKRIELEVYVDNASAINLYKKYDFLVEGTLQKYAFRDGSYVNAYAMAKIKQ